MLALLLAAPALAGCLGGDDPTPAPPMPDPATLPPGCDATRPAIAHLAAGAPAAARAAPLPIPCLLRTGYDSAEPTLGLTASGALFFYPATTGAPRLGEVGGPLLLRTRDAGATWEEATPSLDGEPTHKDTADPLLFVDSATSRVFVDDLQAAINCSLLSWSDDDGSTWDHAVAGCAETDQQVYFAGPPVSSPTLGYPSVLYRCAQNGGGIEIAATMTTCQRSLDGGATWLPPGGPAYVSDPARAGHYGLPGACGGATGFGIADTGGRIYLPKGWCGEPWLAWSDDEGVTWTRAQVSDIGMSQPGDNSNKTQDGENPVFGSYAWRAGVGVDPAGAVYYAWIAGDRLPYVAVSRNGGAKWDQPMMVGPPGIKEASLPSLAVGGVGKVAVSYYGSTNAPGAPYPEPDCLADPVDCLVQTTPPEYEAVTWNGYVTVAYDADADAPVFLSTSVNDPSDPLLRRYCGSGCSAAFDFLDLRIGPDGTPWATFVDGCTEACATGERMTNNAREGLVGRLWGGASLWDDEDANGPYP